MAKRATPQPRKTPLRVVSKSPADPVAKAKAANGEGSNSADLEAFHYHVGCIRRAKAAVAAVRKTLKSERRRASDAGLNLGDLDLVLKMSEEEPETVQATIRRIAQYAGWMGLAPGVQGDLFQAADEKSDALKTAEHEGYVDGLEGITPEGERYDAASETGQARLKGWNRGQDVIKERWLDKQVEAPPETQTDIEDVPEGATVQ